MEDRDRLRCDRWLTAGEVQDDAKASNRRCVALFALNIVARYLSTQPFYEIKRMCDLN